MEIADCEDFRYVDRGDGHFGLRLADVFPQDAGTYCCEAYNEHGEATTSSFLSVRGDVTVRTVCRTLPCGYGLILAKCCRYPSKAQWLLYVPSALTFKLGPCHGADGQSPASHRGGPGSITGQSVWDLWWTKWHWDRFFPEYFGFPCQFHSTGATLTN